MDFFRTVGVSSAKAGPFFASLLIAHAAMGQQGGSDSTALPINDSVRQQRMVHIAPQRIMLDGNTRTATLTFSNKGKQPSEADVHVLFAYTDWPHGLPADTTLFTRQWETVFARDTVVLNPRPTDPFAGRWLSGVPTHITLKPGETRTVPIRISPPAGLPTGTYWARIVTIVSPPTRSPKGNPKDVRAIYQVPIRGSAPPTLRDSTLLFYRQGPVKIGLAIGPMVAAIDTLDLPSPGYIGGTGQRKMWQRITFRLTGNTPFEGTLSDSYQNVATGEEINLTPVGGFMLYRDAVTHWWGQADMLKPGRYRWIVRAEATQSDIPPAQRLPMVPVADTVEFDVPR